MANRPKRSTLNKAAIIEKSGSLFLKKGYDRTSMRDIARSCGYEAGNIYNYFRNKEQLLYEVIKEETERFISLIKHIEVDDITNPVEQLRSLIEIHFNFILGKKGGKLIFDKESKNLTPAHRKKIIESRDMWESIVRKIIRRGIDTGDFAEIDEKVVVYALASIIVRGRIWFSPKGRLSSNEIGDIISKIIINGLKGRG
ncbi:TetR/AcrR family transcriptional regulator [Chloroflexota bacterium]